MNSVNINIRLALPDDAFQMAEISSLSWEAAYKDIIPMEFINEQNATRLALFKRIITADNDKQYIIECDSKAVGIMCVAPPQVENIKTEMDTGIDDSFWELHGIYLHPDYFHQGIGTTALEFAFNKAKENRVKNMIVWVFAENLSTIKFYEKCGFVADGATKLYYCGKKVNCIRMRVSL